MTDRVHNAGTTMNTRPILAPKTIPLIVLVPLPVTQIVAV